MTHEWKVGDRAIADGFGCDIKTPYEFDGDIVFIHNAGTRLATVSTLDDPNCRVEIHVRNLTPDRRKGERRKGLSNVISFGSVVDCRGVFKGSVDGCRPYVVEVTSMFDMEMAERRSGKDRRVKA